MKYKVVSFAMAIILLFSSVALADIEVGDSILSLGADLNYEQKEELMKELNAQEDTAIVEVTNEEEHRYLSRYIPKAQIGTKALSSAIITYTKAGSGVEVKVSNKIRYVKPEIYKNTLITAGISDASIVVSAPVEVSGTAALTGILKAYEVSTGKVIPEELKEAANEELVLTSKIDEVLGEGKAASLINAIKIQIAENSPKSSEEVKTIINNTINNKDISLSEEQIDQLTNMFYKMKGLNIDWNKTIKEAEKIKDKATEYFSSEEGQSFLQNLKVWFSGFIDWFAGIFK